jgi:hypothetical protein
VSFEVEIRFIECLPDSIQIGLAIGSARRAISLCGERHDSDGHHCREDGIRYLSVKDFTHCIYTISRFARRAPEDKLSSRKNEELRGPGRLGPIFE